MIGCYCFCFGLASDGARIRMMITKIQYGHWIAVLVFALKWEDRSWETIMILCCDREFDENVLCRRSVAILRFWVGSLMGYSFFPSRRLGLAWRLVLVLVVTVYYHLDEQNQTRSVRRASERAQEGRKEGRKGNERWYLSKSYDSMSLFFCS